MKLEKPLLILDLDETLVRSLTAPLARPAEFVVAHYSVYFRPGVREFLSLVNQSYTLGLWSSATMAYVAPIAIELWRGLSEPLFVWDRERCTPRYDFHKQEEYFLKDLRRVERNGVDLKRVLIVDDEFRKLALQYGNALLIRPYLGAESDDELLQLGHFLEQVKDMDNLQKIDKGPWAGWRNR